MITRSKMKHEILLASPSAHFRNIFRKETSSRDFILDTVNSPKKLALWSRKRNSPDMVILDLNFIDKQLSMVIFHLKQFKHEIPVVIISKGSDVSLLDKVNKNLHVLLSLSEPSNKQSIKDLVGTINDFFNEDLKKKLIKVEYVKEPSIFACTFANKEIVFIKRKQIPDDQADAQIVSCEISPDKYFFNIHYDNNKSTDVPWDFVRDISDRGDERKRENITAEEVGQRISQIRVNKNMTQDDLASKTGILRNNISRMEKGGHYPSLPVLEKIAEALNIPVVRLIAK